MYVPEIMSSEKPVEENENWPVEIESGGDC